MVLPAIKTAQQIRVVLSLAQVGCCGVAAGKTAPTPAAWPSGSPLAPLLQTTALASEWRAVFHPNAAANLAFLNQNSCARDALLALLF